MPQFCGHRYEVTDCAAPCRSATLGGSCESDPSLALLLALVCASLLRPGPQPQTFEACDRAADSLVEAAIDDVGVYQER